ncbi:MAG: beta-glucosidase BglX [Armatimonadetes bacterium]|nr:beta-glucosidase BglX [Armatimonadota bacterium]
MLHEYREAFGGAPLRERVGFALPGKAVPKGPLGAYSHKSASDTEARIEGLIRKMTLEEKLGQMTQFSYGESPISLEAMTMTEKAGVSTKAEAALELYKSLTREGRLGSVLNCFGAAKTNELQRIAVEESRLGIPLLFGYDVIHGYRTIFPIPLGQAATWNPALVEKGARAAAVEASSEGVNWNFSPMVDIARDPRWGRVAEGAGEDPYLGSAMGVAQVRGYQTEDLGAPGTVAACAKHYVAYGAAVAGRDYNTVDISERTLREVYLPPFEASVKGGVATLMSAFNDLNGIPASGNRHTITDILRSEWGFQGFVVSDWESIAQLVPHGFAADRDQAGREAVLAGVDMDMVDGIYMQSLPRLVKNGAVPMEVIDEAVRRILRIKLRKGLFERPYTDPHVAEKVILCCEHRKTALDLARESLVLLRNEKNLLPLGDDLRSIALIGPLADDRINILGSWTAQGRGEDTATVLEALKARVKPGCKVAYTRGCPIQGEAPEDEITKAVQVAQASDVIILVLGEAGDMCGEAASRTSIALPGDQEKLLRAVVATGKPVALVLLSGRPLTFPADLVPAVLEAWFPGTRGAQAVVEALFADINPGGKLPISFPRNVGQIPIFYNSKSTGRPAKETDKFTSKYLDAPNSPMYPFGHGLSYTTFAYSGLKLGAERIRAGSDMEVRVTVTNTGPRAGDEVVQLYIQDLVASATRPVLELKGFHRIRLTPGESHEVTFVLAADSMASYDRSMKKGIEPGKFRVQVGGSSADGLEALFEVE